MYTRLISFEKSCTRVVVKGIGKYLKNVKGKLSEAVMGFYRGNGAFSRNNSRLSDWFRFEDRIRQRCILILWFIVNYMMI